ncbi:hypothetical protein JMJ35_005771 [Cladonia borealis]|uniref:CFEM domain-containing protein n=1 Tax=Cladonia borealis TaxID=184061 RepID=A0AA39R0P4_9LECA|nr:hypothetical protein JMJ35_005771 [Cladonia borealis]
MHSIHIPFIAIHVAQVVCVPQVSSQITSPPVPTATASSNTSSVATYYPVCAQICANETLPATGCSVFNTECACSVDYRSKLAACQISSCSSPDMNAAITIEEQLCARTYSDNTTLSSQVVTAVTAATSSTSSYTKGKDPTEPLNYPPCAQSCVSAHNFAGCGSYSNKSCICKSPTYTSIVGSCYRSFCIPADVQAVADLTDALCESVGGTGNFSNSSILPFTASAPSALARIGLWLPSSIVGGLMVLLFAW